MLTPFVKPRQVLSYLVLAIAPGCKSIAQDFMRVSQIFVCVTRLKWSQNYSVSESGGASCP